ncbi:hypothetical protein TMatcc_003352 [Talaromyces marneffei ATCC 18224]|nr:hypothetical protein EYB25_000744 [Talaromyces marneffei]
MDETTSHHWYFAYGSNMSLSVLTGRRSIKPLKVELVSIPSHVLCFNVPGMPYTEPAMGGISQKQHKGQESVTGVAYMLTDDDFSRLVASEGGGIAYTLVQLDSLSLRDGSTIPINTFTARRPVSIGKQRLPSERYMGLLINGAKEHGLPPCYIARLVVQPTFRAGTTRRWILGRWLFNLLWQPVSRWIQWGVRTYMDSSGHVPTWYLTGFDFLLDLMWAQHDYLHRFLWGRGDGLQ